MINLNWKLKIGEQYQAESGPRPWLLGMVAHVCQQAKRPRGPGLEGTGDGTAADIGVVAQLW
jgi:hypothetical protein